MYLEILVFVFIGIAIYQSLYFLIFFTKPVLGSLFIKHSESANTSCTIIIVCQNEEDFIENKLPYLLNQQVSVPFEIIVVDLNSSDNTALLLNKYQKQYSFLRSIKIEQEPKSIPIRNYAFSVGVIEASYDKVVYIDNAKFSSCSPDWLEEMMLPFNHQSANIVLGYTTFKKENTMTNQWRRYINLHHKLISLGFSQYKAPVFTSMNNVVFDKKLFLKDKMFVHTNHVKQSYKQSYGLLKGEPIFINDYPNSTMYQKLSLNFSFEYERWYASLFSYPTFGYNIINFLYFISQICFWILGAISIYIVCTNEFVDTTLFYVWISIFLFREFLYLFYFIKMTLYRVKEKDILGCIFVGDILYSFHVLYYFMNIFISSKKDLK